MGCFSIITSIFEGIINFFEAAWDAAIDLLESALVSLWEEIGYPIVKFVFNALGYTDETVYVTSIITTKLLTSEVADSMSLGILRAILNNTGIVDELLRTLKIGPVTTTENYLDYAKDYYTHGLPNVSYDFRKFDEVATKAIIEAEIGAEIQILTGVLGYPSLDAWCTHWLNVNLPIEFNLRADIGVNPIHYVAKSQGFIYVPDGPNIEKYADTWNFMPVGEGSFWEIYMGIPSDTRWWEYDPITNTFRIPYREDSSTFRWINNIPGPAEEEYYFIEYILVDDIVNPNNIEALQKYSWQYQRGLGQHTVLDDPTGYIDYYNEVLPIVPLRRDFYGTNDATSPTHNAEEERTARILLNKLNLDYDELIQSIADNPDEDKVEDAFLMFATNLYTEDAAELQVLFNLFENFHNDTLITKDEFLLDTTKVTTNVIRIREQYFNAVISYNYTDSYIEDASDPIGTIIRNVTVVPNGSSGDPAVNSYFTLSKQINDSQRKVILVHGPVIYHHLRTTAGVFKVMTLELSVNQQAKDSFSIPLTLDSLDGLTYYDKEKVLYRALTIVVYAADEQWVVWYETERFTKAFIAILEIVSIYLTIASFNTTSSVWSAVIQVAKQVLISYAITILIYEILQEYGEDGALALILVAAATFFSGDNTWADALMDLVLFTIDVSISLTNLAMLELDREGADFLKTQEEKEEELQEAWDMLDSSGDIDLFDLQMILNTHPEESPGDFYNRTIHTGNPGVALLDQIPDYADSMLQLPEFKQDLGGSSFTNI